MEWTKIYEYSSDTSPGKANRFLSWAGVARIKRSRYAHQALLAVTLANEAFEAQSEFRNYKDFKRRSATATYWFPVTELEILLFTYVDLAQ